MTDNKVLFWALIVTGIFLLAAILMIGKAIENYLKTDDFKKKLKEFKDEEAKKLKSGMKMILLPLLAFYSLSSLSPAMESTEAVEGNFYTSFNVYLVLIIDLVLLVFMLYLRSMFMKFFNINKKEEDLLTAESKVKETTDKVTQFLTDTVPLDKEYTILLDHEYDGIEELDNNLPPWWKYGFYLSIVAAVIYLFNYHVLKISPLQGEEYEIEMAQAEVDVAKYLEDQALNVDENTVAILTDPSDISSGLKMFNQYCVACHMEGGSGNVGPNLTDDYWIYDGDIKGIFKTIKYGAKNGMKSWKDELNPVQMQQVSSYITTLRGTNPPNAKEPEGELIETASTEPELVVEQDSIPVN